MHASRRMLLASASTRAGLLLPGVEQKFLLPPATFWDNMWSAVQGVWSIATNPTHRQAFEDAITSNVIKDTVLQNAYNGSTMTFSLFWNLQNPLWKRNTAAPFDAKEFAQAVGPALTNLHDFLHSFQNQIRQEYIDFQTQEENTSNADTESSSSSSSSTEAVNSDVQAMDKLIFERILPNPAQQQHLIKFLSQTHPWRQQAKEDPDSLAGRLSRITTEEYLQGFCVSSKMGLAVTNQAVYEEGSATVGQVAILSARAMEIPLPGQVKSDDDDEDYRYEEFKASEEANLKMGVAAQIDVLYEVTNRFHEQVPVSDDELQTPSSTDSPPQLKTEHVEYTCLGVAVFEGWLDKGDEADEEGLRWRVPLIREPVEFPMTVSAMRTVLPPTAEEEAPTTKDEKTTQETESREKEEDKATKETENKSKGEESSSSSSS